MRRKFEVKSGDKYNRWTAIKYDEIDTNRNNRWIFRCKCGTEQSLPVPEVVNGRTKSCRHCKNSKNLNGKKFGNWKVLEKLPKLPSHAHTKWLCKCKCGNEVAVDQSNLVNKISKQCNECRSRVKIRNKTPIPNKFWAKVMYRAGDRKINWNLTEEEAWDIWLNQNGKCKLTSLASRKPLLLYSKSLVGTPTKLL